MKRTIPSEDRVSKRRPLALRAAALALAIAAALRLDAGEPSAGTPQFWSLTSVRKPALPTVVDQDWPRTGIDRFILSRLETDGLTPVRDADRRTLIRRVTFDLTGLPPTAAEIADFLQDNSLDAFVRVVDRLLASPAYGERWGRHWLDVVRYADTAGETADYPVREAYLYRNWVIRALNADKPYDQFIREQVAGDLLARAAPRDDYADLVTATGFIAISRRFGFDPENYHQLTIADTLDTLGQSVLGLSIGCARCHDHKYDPIDLHDYYALYGIFDSTRYSFPGSEEKKRPRDMLPALPPGEAATRQQQFDAELTARRAAAATLAARKIELESEQSLLKVRLEAFQPKPTEAADRSTEIDNPYLWLIQLRRLSMARRDTDGRSGVHAWRTEQAPEPIVLANSTAETLKIPGTMPPRSLAVHPPARGGVAVGWRSPIAGEIAVRGSVAHAHGECGDGVAWALDRLGETPSPLASGEIDQAGRQEFAQGTGGERLSKVTVRPGEVLQLVVLPRANHGCDLTLVDWRIEELSGERRVWDLAAEVVPDLLAEGKGNPHGDSRGNPAVWYFYQTADDRGLAADLSKFPRDLPATRARLAEVGALLDSTAKAQAAAAEQLARFERQPPFDSLYAVLDGPGRNARIQKRGEIRQLGDEVPRRFLAALGGDPVPADETGSGRLQLAHWLTRPENPLTARVLVNRLWQHHFGGGLVRTENDFGERGARPTHPELLDYLATECMRCGWSMKSMHRQMLVSRVYQLASADDPRNVALDPDNKLLWRFRRQRLDAESIRDSLLFLGGDLDGTMGGPHPFPDVSTWNFTQHNPFVAVYDSPRRSVYLMQQRIRRHPFLALFDGADPNVSTAHRDTTTVPTQSLFLMNDPFVHEQSLRFAAGLQAGHAEPAPRLDAAYVATLARPANEAERARALEFLAAYAGQLQASGLPAPQVESESWAALVRTLFVRNEFLFVE